MKEKLVTTVVVDKEAEQIAQYSVPLMEKYAKFLDADFLILKKTDISEIYGKPHYEKYQIGFLLNRYKRVLFLDADILVSPESIDIFKLVPENKIGAVSIENINQKIHKEKENIIKILGPVPWIQPYFNSGVMLFSDRHKSIFLETTNSIRKWEDGKLEESIKAWNDQTLINYFLNYYGFELFDLGMTFNFTRAWGNFHYRFNHHFIHYAGLKGNRDWQMKRDFQVLNSQFKRKLFASYPKLVWMWDKWPTFLRRF